MMWRWTAREALHDVRRRGPPPLDGSPPPVVLASPARLHPGTIGGAAFPNGSRVRSRYGTARPGAALHRTRNGRVDRARTPTRRPLSANLPSWTSAPTGKRHDEDASVVDQALRLGWSGHFEMTRTSWSPCAIGRLALGANAPCAGRSWPWRRPRWTICRRHDAWPARRSTTPRARRPGRHRPKPAARPPSGTGAGGQRGETHRRPGARAPGRPSPLHGRQPPAALGCCARTAKLHWLDAPSPVQRYAKLRRRAGQLAFLAGAARACPHAVGAGAPPPTSPPANRCAMLRRCWAAASIPCAPTCATATPSSAPTAVMKP